MTRAPLSRLGFRIALTCLAAAAALTLRTYAQTSPTVAINGQQQRQVMDGFGVSANVASWNGGELRPALDLLVDQLGASLFRVVIDNGDWEATNDNGDPFTFNWTYYGGIYDNAKFQELWNTIGYLNQKGITSGLMLNIMGPVAGWMGGGRINASAEDEWVEMITSLVYYGRVNRGLSIPLLAPLNEPDWDAIEGPQVEPGQYVRLLRKLAQRLDAVGLADIRLVGPDTAQVWGGVSNYLAEMMTDPVVMGKVDQFAFHNYAGDSGGADAAIKSSAYPTKRFWITEVSNIWDALAHLSQGPAATFVWDAYDSVYNHAILAGRGTTPPNDAGNGPALLAYNSTSRTYTPRKAFHEHTQLFRFVRPGSRRIGTTVSGSGLTIYAFHHLSSGRVTVVGRNTSTSGRTITGTLANLPSIPAFEFYQTTVSTNFQRGADVAVSNGAFAVQVAGSSVFTLTAATAADAQPPTVAITSPAGGTVSGTTLVSASATDNVGVAGVQFLIDNAPLGTEDTGAPFEVPWNTAAASSGQHSLSARASDHAGNVSVAAAVWVTVDNSDGTPPSVAIVSPSNGATLSGTVTVSAAASDNIAVSGVQFLLDGSPLGAEDLTSPFTASWNTIGAPNGSHVLAARARDAAGNIATSAVVPVTVSNSVSPPPAGLVAAYGFDESAGTQVQDGSGNGHTGTIAGAVRTAAGRFGGALSFDGVNDLVSVADASALDLTTALTLEAWVRPTAASSWRTVVLKERSGGLAYALYASNNQSRPAGYISPAGDIGVTAPATISLNTWTHLSLTYDGGSLRLYVNGTLASSVAQTGPTVTSTSPLRIGGDTIWSEYFAGLIDEVRIYNRALSATEIQGDMNIAVDAAAPTVSVTAPASGATVSGTVTVTATASDNIGVVGVQFLLDGAPLGGEATTAPFSTAWTTTAAANGTHTLTARARDAAGNQTTSATVAVTVANDATPPIVAVTAPLNGSTVSGTVAVAASASDDIGVVGVQFLLDGAPLSGEATTAPFSTAWTTTAAANGTHTLTARARDAAGNQTTSATVTVTVANDATPPIVAVTAPLNGSTVSGTVAVAASASDDIGVVGVQFLLDGAPLGGEDPTAPFSVSWGTVSTPNGAHTLAARARDAAGHQTTSTTVSVTVINDTTPPNVAVTAPASGSTVGGTITITASASDDIGIAAVQFLLDGAPLGSEDAAAPFSVSWDTASASNDAHTLTARARDVSGNLTTSAPVTVTVANASPPPLSGLVAAYGFEEASGSSASDASGLGHTGTISGALRTTAGRFGAALAFDGIDDLVTIADAPALDLTTGATLEAWVRPSTSNSWRTVVLKERPGGLTYALYASNNLSRPAAYIWPNADIGITAPATIALNTWTHLATTYDGATFRLYVNGAQVASVAQSGAIDTSSNPIRIGGDMVWFEYFGGLIDEVRIYNRALSGAEIQTDMNSAVVDTTPPAVSLTSPAPAATVSGTVAVTATASDNVGVVGVQFLLDGAPLGSEDTTAPFSVTWNTTAATSGGHTLTARARDAGGNQTTSAPVTVTVSNDAAPPSAAVTAPSNGATVSGAITLAASASDDIGVVGVQFLLDGAPLGVEDTTAPFSVTWNTASTANGGHTLAARARDAVGNQTTSTTVTVTVSNGASPPASGLVAAYGFDETSGSVTVDASGQGNSGTISGALRTSSGRFGGALTFDGINDLVTVADSASLDLTTGMTLEAWVRPATVSNWQTALLKESPSGLVYALYASEGATRPSGYVRVLSADVGTTGPGALPVNVWSHIALTYDGSMVRLYVNGSQVAARSLSGSIAASASPLRIGGNTVWNEYFAGLIDEVRVYNRALSAAEIQADMNTALN